MAKKKRQRISYVLPLASSPGGHRLGVNGLAYDTDRSILYTGGRDGVVCAWDLDIAAQDANDEIKEDQNKRQSTIFRKQVQAHTHWVNDIVLVKNNLGLVSASSDVTVKLWRPHSDEQSSAYTIGTHSDYIKCLATPDKSANWVASGGLDHRICLWDLGGGGKTLEINVGKDENIVKGSIYTLRAQGATLASGGPESVVRVWDIRTGQSITKLVGHTDNVRDLLVSDDGDTILSASADQTIKVWSLTAGRCLHTMTMHNDSVWCMYSDDPSLAVFYSGDRSGLVAKTDTRRAMEIDDAVSVAVCQEHDGIIRVAAAGNSIWTATSSSSVNRWRDVDTEAEVQSPPLTPRHHRSSSALTRETIDDSPEETPPSTPSSEASEDRIPHNAVLRISSTAPVPGRKFGGRNPSISATNIRKASEAIIVDDLMIITPVRGRPSETIAGQNGLVKHVMLNDRKRVLTIDTAGEVVLWDLLKCIPIKSFGRRHLDEVVPEVNTLVSVANWCNVDTKTGKLTVQLEENYCFDAEVYADEIEVAEKIEFREDQRVNLGKWVLRYLFAPLVDEEIRRDEEYRKTLRSPQQAPNGLLRPNAPRGIKLPELHSGSSPLNSVTPRASAGPGVLPTPGLAIGVATPGRPRLSVMPMSPMAEEGSYNSKTEPPSSPDLAGDYFSASAASPPSVSPMPSNIATPSNGSTATPMSATYGREALPDHSRIPTSPGADGAGLPTPLSPSFPLTPSTPLSPGGEERKKGAFFGKKFQMNFPKKLARTNTTDSKLQPTVEEKAEDTASTDSAEKEEKIIEDNFFGVIQKIRQEYDDHMETKSNQQLGSLITPSLPSETPVLRPPQHTSIIVQEDNPESGGLADLYRGEISSLEQDFELLEKTAPMWLGELLLRNKTPFKDTVKVSFILNPLDNLLPQISSTESNARLNANRMLRARKIIAYVAERIEAPAPPPDPNKPADPFADPSDEDPDNLKPEEYLELYCQGQKVDPNTTLATLRTHIWRMGGDVVLCYKANGRKKIKLPHPSDVPTKEESASNLGVAR